MGIILKAEVSVMHHDAKYFNKLLILITRIVYCYYLGLPYVYITILHCAQFIQHHLQACEVSCLPLLCHLRRCRCLSLTSPEYAKIVICNGHAQKFSPAAQQVSAALRRLHRFARVGAGQNLTYSVNGIYLMHHHPSC